MQILGNMHKYQDFTCCVRPLHPCRNQQDWMDNLFSSCLKPVLFCRDLPSPYRSWCRQKVGQEEAPQGAQGLAEPEPPSQRGRTEDFLFNLKRCNFRLPFVLGTTFKNRFNSIWDNPSTKQSLSQAFPALTAGVISHARVSIGAISSRLVLQCKCSMLFALQSVAMDINVMS